MHERAQRPDLILFADTGGEKPETYHHREVFDEWLKEARFPPITMVRNTGYLPVLYDNVWRKQHLPSLAYGRKRCSLRYKREPQDRWVNRWPPAKLVWANGGKVIKYIGIDFGEQRRAKIHEDEKYLYEYPLIDWGWEREDCLAAIERAGLPVPPKSACYYCPASTKKEVVKLSRTHPRLFAKAVAMERRAVAAGNLITVVGLGRHWTWEGLVQMDDEQRRVEIEAVDQECMCFDGEPDEDE